VSGVGPLLAGCAPGARAYQLCLGVNQACVGVGCVYTDVPGVRQACFAEGSFSEEAPRYGGNRVFIARPFKL
jgi:hypothetical protein